MHRRKISGRRSSSPLRWLGWLALLLVVSTVVLTLLAPTLATRLIRAYLLREEFRQKAEAMLSTATGGEAEIPALAWHDDSVSAGEIRLLDAHGWDAEAEGVHAALNFGAIRDGVWRIDEVGADELRLRPSPVPHAGQGSTAATTVPGTPAGAAAGADSVPFFLRRYVPARTEVSGCDVQRFFLEHGGWRIDGSRLHAGAWRSGSRALPFSLSGGSLQIPVVLPEQPQPLKLDIDKGTLRVSEGQVQLSNARLRWKEAAEATLRGSIKFQENSAWQAFAHVQGVPVAEFLSAWWKKRLGGQLKGDLEFSGSRGAPMAWKADMVMENGVLEGLPLLETLAAYTRVERFKRLVLDVCQATFRPQGEAVHVDNLVIQSNGLLRIEGAMTLRGRVVNGDFLAGVTTDTLRWLPGAQSRVFVEKNPQGPPGMLWARVHVAGTLDAPQEDLSSRLLGGAGMALLFDTPGQVVNQGAEALLKPVLGEDAAKLPGKVMEGASGLLENGVKTGAGLLDQVLPVLPGGR